jgi:hypothetical protein
LVRGEEGGEAVGPEALAGAAGHLPAPLPNGVVARLHQGPVRQSYCRGRGLEMALGAVWGRLLLWNLGLVLLAPHLLTTHSTS